MFLETHGIHPRGVACSPKPLIAAVSGAWRCAHASCRSEALQLCIAFFTVTKAHFKAQDGNSSQLSLIKNVGGCGGEGEVQSSTRKKLDRLIKSAGRGTPRGNGGLARSGRPADKPGTYLSHMQGAPTGHHRDQTTNVSLAMYLPRYLISLQFASTY